MLHATILSQPDLESAVAERVAGKLEGHGLAHVVVVEGCHHVRVEAQHIPVTNSISNAVSVQFIAKHIRGCVAFFQVL